MPAVKTGFGAPPMPGMPAPMGGMAPMPGMAPMGQPMGGMPMPPMAPPPAPMGAGMPPMGSQMPTMGQGSGQMQGFSMGAPRRRRFGDYLETTLGRFAQPSQPVAADSMGQMNVFTGQMPMQAPMQRPVVGMKRGGLAGGDVEAPRRATIMGQDHMLAYITPEEAGVLKARGGWGGPGPRGIPSYPEPGYGSGGMGDPAGPGPGEGGGRGGGGADSGQAAAAADAAAAAASGGGGGGYDAFGDAYGSAAAAAVADAVAEAAAAAANAGLAGSGMGYGAQAAADTAAALGGWGTGPSAQQSVSQPGMPSSFSPVSSISVPSDMSMMDTFDPEYSFGMTAPSVSPQSAVSPAAPSVDVSPGLMSANQSIASDMAQDMMGLSASQSQQSAATQAAVDAAMDRGGISSGNMGPGMPGMGVTASDVAAGNMATTGVPGGLGSVSTNAASGGLSPAQASGIVSAIGDISRGTGSDIAANEAAAAQMATSQGITAEDVAMSQPVSVAPGNLAPSNAVTGLDVDMSQDVMGLLGDITPTSAAASAPSATVDSYDTGLPATTADIAGMINAVESEVASKGDLSPDRAAQIAANFGVTADQVSSTAAAVSRGLAAAPSTTAPAATTTAPATSTSAPAISSGIDRGLAQAAAQQAVSDTVANMGPLSGGQVAAIADEFGLSRSEVAAMTAPSVSTGGTSPASSQGLAAAPVSAPAATSQEDPAVAAAIESASRAMSQTPVEDEDDSAFLSAIANPPETSPNSVYAIDDQVVQAMKDTDTSVKARDVVESIMSNVFSVPGLNTGITPAQAAQNRSDRANAALEGFKSGKGIGDYGLVDGYEPGDGPDDRGCPPGFVYNPSTRTCVPIGSMSPALNLSDVDVTASDTVGGINVPIRPVETFEDVMARISSGAPAIAPLGQPLRMQAGGAVGLNRAADSFLRALAG